MGKLSTDPNHSSVVIGDCPPQKVAPALLQNGCAGSSLLSVYCVSRLSRGRRTLLFTVQRRA